MTVRVPWQTAEHGGMVQWLPPGACGATPKIWVYYRSF